jgi:hypothetical protein
MAVFRLRRSILLVSAILAAMCAAPRPTRGGEWSPEYQAGLKKTAESNKARRTRKKEVAMKQPAARQAAAAMMRQVAMQEALWMEQGAMRQAMMMQQQVAMQQAAMAQSAASRGYRLGTHIYTVDDTFATVAREEASAGRVAAFLAIAQVPPWMSYYGTGGSVAPEIDAGPAAGAVALLVAGMLMLADRRRVGAA